VLNVTSTPSGKDSFGAVHAGCVTLRCILRTVRAMVKSTTEDVNRNQLWMVHGEGISSDEGAAIHLDYLIDSFDTQLALGTLFLMPVTPKSTMLLQQVDTENMTFKRLGLMMDKAKGDSNSDKESSSTGSQHSRTVVISEGSKDGTTPRGKAMDIEEGSSFISTMTSERPWESLNSLYDAGGLDWKTIYINLFATRIMRVLTGDKLYDREFQSQHICGGWTNCASRGIRLRCKNYRIVVTRSQRPVLPFLLYITTIVCAL
jgi:hypothetical protein